MKPYQPLPDPAELPYIIAHRGISAKAPENTLSSFSRAVATPGVKMIELDVRMSQDEHIIVLHDRTLQRTSTGNGAVRNYTLKELKEFDAGSWFHSSYASERIPTLTEVLQLTKDTTWVNIELKGDFFSRNHERFVERVIETVRKEGSVNQVLYSSFTHDLLAQVRRIEPQAVTGVIYNIYRDFGRPPSKLARRVHASVFVCAKHELQKSMIRDARQNGLALYVYTLNSIQDARRMIQLGVDGIMTNNADGIIAELSGRM